MQQIYPIFVLILVVWLVILLVWHILVRLLLHWQTTMVEGCIIDKSQIRSLRYGTSYYLKYTYRYHEKTYAHKTKVDEASYYIWSEGDNVSVRCFPAFGYIALLDL